MKMKTGMTDDKTNPSVLHSQKIPQDLIMNQEQPEGLVVQLTVVLQSEHSAVVPTVTVR